MCGISGIINKDHVAVDSYEIEAMTDIIHHRGPDGFGYYYGDNFAFGHRRLAIIDLSEAGHQPMLYKNKYVITYNGEIYNYIEIKEELLKYGYQFSSETDTEVILASYDKWGKDCVNKFNGMWSFAIYDKEENIIFCSRDRFGVKPFYYTHTEDKFIFGSEIKQLLKFKIAKANYSVLVDYLVSRVFEYSNMTFFRDIFKLNPATNLIYNLKTNEIQLYKYYEILQNNVNLVDPILSYKEELLRSIKYRLRSDVKVGSCLSGGLDSSSICALASVLLKDRTSKFVVVHAKSIEKKGDESYFAQNVAERLGFDLNIVIPTFEDFKLSINDVVYTQEEPFGSPSVFMQYFTMGKAKEIGCKVMLDGQGGDETLLGYERYYPAIYLDIFRRHGIFSMLKNIILSSKNNSRMNIKNILKQTLISFFPNIRKKAYIKECNFVKKEFLNDFYFLNSLSNNYFDVFKLQKYEIGYSTLPALLRYEDKNSMRHSVETRLPFLDYKTLECALSIDSEMKIKDGWTKYLLREIIKDILSEDVVFRKNKLGFEAPSKSWLESMSNEAIKEIKSSKILSHICNIDLVIKKYDSISDLIKFRLFNIAVWEKVYNVKVD